MGDIHHEAARFEGSGKEPDGSLEKIIAIVDTNPELVHSKDDELKIGNTPLHYATARGWSPLVSPMLRTIENR
jgi:hypothetical protein